MLKLGIRWLYSFYCVSRLYGLVLLLLFIVFKLEWEYETSLIFYITDELTSNITLPFDGNRSSGDIIQTNNVEQKHHHS
jgi:hypothetical protein